MKDWFNHIINRLRMTAWSAHIMTDGLLVIKIRQIINQSMD